MIRRLRLCTLLRRAASLVVLAACASPAVATVVADFAMFGDRQVTVGGSIGGANNLVGPIGSNGLVQIANNGNVTSVSGGGMFSMGGSPDVFGNVRFNGDATFGDNALVVGDVDSGGAVKFGGSANVTGNIRAAGDVQFGNNGVVTGNVDAGGNGKFGSNNGISGNLTLGGTITMGSPTVGGATSQNGSPAAPAAFSPVTVPGESGFSPGAVSHSVGSNSSITLAPGAYNNITLGGSSDLILTTPGEYQFNSLTMGGSGKLFLDLDAGVFTIFVADFVSIGTSLKFWDLSSNTVRDAFSGSTPTSDAALGGKLYLEVGGNFQAGNNSEWFGTIFAPDGDISFNGSADVAGALYAGNQNADASGGTVNFTDNALVAHFGFIQAVPELQSAALWTALTGLYAGLAGWRRVRPSERQRV
jgi:hypothetical protein